MSDAMPQELPQDGGQVIGLALFIMGWSPDGTTSRSRLVVSESKCDRRSLVMERQLWVVVDR